MSVWGLEAWTLGNGVEVERTLDPATGRITAITAGPSHNASLASLAYSYGAAGNTTGAYDVLTGVGRTLTYDALSRLTNTVVSNGSGNHNRDISIGRSGVSVTWTSSWCDRFGPFDLGNEDVVCVFERGAFGFFGLCYRPRW